MKLIEIGNNKFVVGLEWYTIEKKELSKFLKEKNVKRYVKAPTRNDKFINVGIPKKEVKDKSLFKYPALAPSLATVKNTSWAGVFKIDKNTYYHIAIGNDGVVLPDGDVIGTQEKVKEIYFKNLELLDDWGELITEGTIDDLYDITLHIKKKFKFNNETLTLLENFIAGKNLYVLSATGIAVLAGLYFMFKGKTQKPVTHLNPAAIQHIQQKPLKPAIPETTVATLQDLVAVCYKAYYDTMIHYPGWSVQGITCTPKKITVQLSKIANAPVVNMQGLNIESSSQATRSVKPSIQTEQIPVGNNNKVTEQLDAWSLRWSDAQLTKQLKQGQFTAMGQSNLSLGDLERIKGVYATKLTLSGGWKVDLVTEGNPQSNKKQQTSSHTAPPGLPGKPAIPQPNSANLQGMKR